MDIILLSLTVILLSLTSISLLVVNYHLKQIQERLNSAMKICQDAVTSLRNGGI